MDISFAMDKIVEPDSGVPIIYKSFFVRIIKRNEIRNLILTRFFYNFSRLLVAYKTFHFDNLAT